MSKLLYEALIHDQKQSILYACAYKENDIQKTWHVYLVAGGDMKWISISSTGVSHQYTKVHHLIAVADYDQQNPDNFDILHPLSKEALDEFTKNTRANEREGE